MSFSNGTNLSSYFQQRFQINSVENSYSVIQMTGALKGSMDNNGVYYKKGQNDIICGNSMCGSEEEPTWQFCFK